MIWTSGLEGLGAVECMVVAVRWLELCDAWGCGIGGFGDDRGCGMIGVVGLDRVGVVAWLGL